MGFAQLIWRTNLNGVYLRDHLVVDYLTSFIEFTDEYLDSLFHFAHIPS